jgi:hypothetical protein
MMRATMEVEDPHVLKLHAHLIATHSVLIIPGKLPLIYPIAVDITEVAGVMVVMMVMAEETIEEETTGLYQRMKTIAPVLLTIEALIMASPCPPRLPTEPPSQA